MTERNATTYIDYQQRASEFSVGDAIVPTGVDSINSGRVVAVYPAIGMVDVEFPHGNKRYPVEDIQRIRQDAPVNEPKHESVPGGAGSVEVSGGPYDSLNSPDKAAPAYLVEEEEAEGERSNRVAKAFLKRSIYWAGVDRKYRANKAEVISGSCSCPKCGTGMKPAIYKRSDGISERLMGCPSCLFLIKRCDVLGLEGE